jgi:hypothetical protein
VQAVPSDTGSGDLYDRCESAVRRLRKERWVVAPKAWWSRVTYGGTTYDIGRDGTDRIYISWDAKYETSGIYGTMTYYVDSYFLRYTTVAKKIVEFISSKTIEEVMEA